MIKFLAENVAFKVYALYENVYLKAKARSSKPDDFEETDLFVTYHYGQPTSAIILDGHIIVAGCGITIFDTSTQQEITLFAEADNSKWTNALHQDTLDEPWEFRYVSYTDADQIRVFKMNVLTQEVVVLT